MEESQGIISEFYRDGISEAGSNPFDVVIERLLVVLLVFMPLAFGVARPWSEEIVIALSGAIVICFLLKLLFCREVCIVRSWAYLPIAIFVGIAVLQLIPLPTGLISTISPNTAAVKSELLGDLPESIGKAAELKSMTLSFYTDATKHNLRLVLAVAAMFVVVLNVFRRPDQIKRLLTAIALIGGGVALIALAQNLFGNDKIYWLVPTAYGQAYSGTFVNHSHYGQFMNLSIGAALGLIMVKLHEDFASRKKQLADVFEYFNSGSGRILWLMVAIMSFGAATVFVSLSRGGMVSMLTAAAFTILVLASRKSLKGGGWIMAIMAIGAFVCVLYIGFDSIYERLATMRDMDRYNDRWQILKDLSVCFKSFPVLGTGLGTHSVVYPMFDSSTIAALAAHAENEYAQATEETGLIGLGSLIAFGTIVWLNYARNIRSSSLAIRSAAYGLGFGLLAILLHSWTDFGQHLPANATLSAIFCALMLVLSRQGTDNRQSEGEKSSWRKGIRTSLVASVLLVVSGVWGWSLVSANRARVAASHWEKAFAAEEYLVEKNWRGSDEEYKALIAHAARASEWQPGNIKYRHWLNVYRWRSVSRLADPNTGELIIPEESVRFVHTIVEDLHKARVYCPTFGATYSILGQIERFILGDAAGSARIRKGYRLAPCSPQACFAAGFLDIEEGMVEQSVEKFKRTVELDGKLFRNVIHIYVINIGRPDLAIDVAGDDAKRLSYVVNVLSNMDGHAELVYEARAKLTKLLEEKCSQPNAPAWVFASAGNIYRTRQDNKAAIEYYQRALALDYGQVQWRYTLAKLLADSGQISEAMHEARVCLRLQPQLKGAKKLVRELSVNPASFEKETELP